MAHRTTPPGGKWWGYGYPGDAPPVEDGWTGDVWSTAGRLGCHFSSSRCNAVVAGFVYCVCWMNSNLLIESDLII
jgi:hypothetical protein